jgi:hypothetical protein
VDFVALAKIAGLIIAGLFLYTIASSGGLEGKIFVLVVLLLGVWLYLRNEAAHQIINPVKVYHDRLALACKRKGREGLRFLVMSGDAHNQKHVKGELLGGAIIIHDRTLKKIPIKWETRKDADGKKIRVVTDYRVEPRFSKDNPHYWRYYFLYTPSYGSIYSLPVIGGLLAAFRKECLICVFKPQLRTLDIVGDVEVKGVNTLFVEQMEYVSDELFDYDFEAANLSKEVDRVALGDEMTQLVIRIRRAVDSNSAHLKDLDKKDFPVGATGEQQGGE